MAKLTTDNSIAGLNRRLAKLPKAAKVRLREGSARVASMVADQAGQLARQVGGVLKYVAPTYRAVTDGVPTIRFGGRAKLPTSGQGWQRERNGTRQTVGDVIWGGEFGGSRPGAEQFMDWRGNQGSAGYAVWPTVRRDRADINAIYSAELAQAERDI